LNQVAESDEKLEKSVFCETFFKTSTTTIKINVCSSCHALVCSLLDQNVWVGNSCGQSSGF